MQAADVVRVLGIGRNEYIAIMNKCKAKKLLWRVNKALAKEFLPEQPLVPAALQPWWHVAIVNVGESSDQLRKLLCLCLPCSPGGTWPL